MLLLGLSTISISNLKRFAKPPNLIKRGMRFITLLNKETNRCKKEKQINNNNPGYCYSYSIYVEICNLFELTFINCKHFSSCFIFFKQRKKDLFKKRNLC